MSTAIKRDVIATAAPSVPEAAISQDTALLAMIERAARDPNVDVDKMERLFAMHERAVAHQAKVAYATALSKLQPDLPQVERHGKIIIREKNNQDNIIQSTPYALWEDINQAIKPLLAREGFALSFRVGQAQDGKITITGVLSHKDGHQEETTLSLQYDSTGSKNAVQSAGSSISYGKRYVAGLLLNFTSRAPEEADDDGAKGGQASAVNDDQLEQLHKALAETKSNVDGFCKLFKIETLSDLPAGKFGEAMAIIAKKRQRGAHQ
jgi:hypothetical protein